MKVLVQVSHPAHVHFYRNYITTLRQDTEVKILAKDKGLTTELLELYGFDFEITSKAMVNHPSDPKRVLDQIKYESNTYRKAKKFQPDIVTGINNIPLAHVSTLLDCKSIIYTDTEHATLQHKLCFPFADVVCTPQTFKKEISGVHLTYDGYHESAYLHPSYFEPDTERLREVGISPEKRYATVRFSSWSASHDHSEQGFTEESKREIVETLQRYGDVYVFDEEQEWETSFTPEIPPHYIHDLLYNSDIFIGDSGTMATEASMLGTPAIRCNSFAIDRQGKYIELQDEYKLLYSTPDEKKAIDRLETHISDGINKKLFRERSKRLFTEQEDVTEFMIDMTRRIQ